MKYIVIGLGNYGSVLAEELALLGHEVIGVDKIEQRVDALKEKITTAFILDSTDEASLVSLPLKEVDVIVVAIGKELESSLRTVALLKKNKVAHIYARAVDKVHSTILDAFGLDEILTPEKSAARSLAQLMDLKVHVKSFEVGAGYYIAKFQIPKNFIGYAVSGLSLEEDFELRVVAVVRGKRIINSMGVATLEHTIQDHFAEDCLLEEGDELVCYGAYKDFMQFWRAI
ncbi:MAG: potassium channel family protein [Phocaeicola sp.]